VIRTITTATRWTGICGAEVEIVVSSISENTAFLLWRGGREGGREWGCVVGKEGGKLF